MLFSFLKKQSAGKSFAVFSIDAAGITFTILSKNEVGSIHISHISRLSLDIISVREPEKVLRNVDQTFNKIFEAFKKNKLHDLVTPHTEIIVLVGSPWHIGWNDISKTEKETEFKVTEKIIQDSIHDSFGVAHSDLAITNINIMQYRLNGYVMENPIRKVTKSLDIGAYISSAPKVFVDMVRTNLKSKFPYNKISFSSYNDALYSAILNSTSTSNCLIIIPEIETTELVLVRGGVIVSEASLPFGGATLAGQLFGAKSSGIKESLLKTKRFVEGTLDVTDLGDLGNKLNTIKETFLTEFHDVVWKMSDTLVLPSEFFVVGRNLATHFVFDWLQSDEYVKNTFTLEDFRISNLRGSDLMADKKLNGLFHHKSAPVSVAVSTQLIVKK